MRAGGKREIFEVVHVSGPLAWEFRCFTVAAIQGGGGSFEASASAAEHAVRQYLSRITGAPVSLDLARSLTRHFRDVRARPAEERLRP